MKSSTLLSDMILLNKLIITRKPKRNRKDGIIIYYKTNGYEENKMFADIRKGQVVYELPKDFTKDNFITDVKLKY